MTSNFRSNDKGDRHGDLEHGSKSAQVALTGAVMQMKWILDFVSVFVFGGSTEKLTVTTEENRRHKCTSYRQFCSATAEMCKDMAMVAIIPRFQTLFERLISFH